MQFLDASRNASIVFLLEHDVHWSKHVPLPSLMEAMSYPAPRAGRQLNCFDLLLLTCFWETYFINSITVLAYTERQEKLAESASYEVIQSDHLFASCLENPYVQHLWRTFRVSSASYLQHFLLLVCVLVKGLGCIYSFFLE